MKRDDRDPFDAGQSVFAVWRWPLSILIPMLLIGCLIGYPVCFGVLALLGQLVGERQR
jgi:hypothetical protein